MKKVNLINAIETIGEVAASIVEYVISIMLYIGFAAVTIIGLTLFTLVAAGQSMLRKEKPCSAMKQALLLNISIIGEWLINLSKKEEEE